MSDAGTPGRLPGTAVGRNLRLLPLHALVGDFLPIAPVLVAWYVAHGLDATAVFTLQAVFAAATVLLEVPSGFFADALGRRTALAVGAAFWPAGLLLYRLGDGFGAFAAAEVTVAVGVSLQSGCLSALLFDSLAVAGRSEEYQRREGHMAAAARWGALLASLAGGFLAARALHLPFELNLLSHSLLLPLAFLLVEPPRQKPALRQAWSEILRVSALCLRSPDLRPWVVGAGLFGAVGLVSLWASFLAYREWGLSLGAYGVLFALFQLGGVLGGHASARLRSRLGLRPFLAVLALPGPLLLLLSVWRGPLAAGVFPVLAFLWNLALPFFLDGLNRRTEARLRATTLSVANLVGRLCFVAAAPLFGLLVDGRGLPLAFGALGVAGLAAIVPVLLRVSREG